MERRKKLVKIKKEEEQKILDAKYKYDIQFSDRLYDRVDISSLCQFEIEYYNKNKICYICKEERILFLHNQGNGYMFSQCRCGRGQISDNIVAVL